MVIYKDLHTSEEGILESISLQDDPLPQNESQSPPPHSSERVRLYSGGDVLPLPETFLPPFLSATAVRHPHLISSLLSDSCRGFDLDRHAGRTRQRSRLNRAHNFLQRI